MFDIKTLDGRHWLCEPMALREILARLQSFDGCYSTRQVAKLRRQRLDRARDAAAEALASTGRTDPLELNAGPRAVRAQSGRVGVVAVHGPMAQRMTSALEKAGGCSCEEIGVALDTLTADATVSAVVMHVDSPGGEVSGVEELSDKIYRARERKAVYASFDSMAASAAYWAGTAAETVTMTPGGYCGSVGVYSLHVNQAKALAAQGYEVSLVSAGRYKAEFLEVVSLTDEARAFLQSVVDDIYGKFVGAVARNRDKAKAAVLSDFGQGRVVGCDKALAAGMIDRCMTFEELMGKLTGTGGAAGNGQRGASVEVLRLRHQWQKQRVAAR
jgi:signal peptide peptidase SppA